MAKRITISLPVGVAAQAEAARRAERAERVRLMAEGHKPKRAATHLSARDKARRRHPKHKGNRYGE